jgi:hypothetical protein
MVFDFRRLEYTYGNSIGMLWVGYAARGTPVVIVAEGPVKAGLEGLIKVSLPVPVIQTEEEALWLLDEIVSKRPR